MWLDDKEIEKLKKEEKFIDIRTDLGKKCDVCGGTGLAGVKMEKGGVGGMWNGEYCNKCKGLGKLDWLASLTAGK